MSSSGNILLSSLSTSDFDLLAPHLESVTLELRKMLEKPNQKIEAVYFPETGFALCRRRSTQRQGSRGRIDWPGRYDRAAYRAGQPSLAACHIYPGGRQGSLHSRDRIAPRDTGERVPSRLPVEVRSGIRRANNAHRDLQRSVQNGGATCPLAPHGAGPNPERHPAAHPRISIAHAWRAPGGRDGRAEGAAGTRLISYRRGEITINDRKGMTRVAGDAYGTPESEYRRLIG